MSHASNEKWQTTHNRRSWTIKSNSHQNAQVLGILEAGTIKQQEMKKKYLGILLQTKLCVRNIVKGINTWVVPLVRYLGPFLKWTRGKIKQMDQRTWKPMTMHKALHPQDDVDRLYVSRDKEGRRLAIIEDGVEASIQQLEDYIEKRGGIQITATRNNTKNMMSSGTTTT